MDLDLWTQYRIHSPMVITVADQAASDALEVALRAAGLRTSPRFVGGLRIPGLPVEPDRYTVQAYLDQP